MSFYSDYSNALRNCLVANPCPGGAVDGTQQTGSKEVYGVEIGGFSGLPSWGLCECQSVNLHLYRW